ncbi:hypothetical protein OQH61_08685 [Helicobacter sp. MIT 21-1697]|uniref:hypothetical protein n=1 Tax=Helicobacter sp. MIT 21-1697 TaxID=2993733 RepID=UPI00224AE1CE|nr:hypothetical protein [Helicobacter sp. MIT 21-1697]MCX2717806.1 hypothetical protein [Helicobacter sp. MIT 21-1697]
MRTITPLPTPPTTNDTASFDIRADAFVEALPAFAQELNAFGVDISNIGESTFERAQEVIKEGQKELSSQHEAFIKQFNQALKAAQLLLRAQSAIKSDAWSALTHYILFELKSLRQKYKEILDNRAKIGQYVLFFRSSLPKGFKPAGSLLKKRDYPLAYMYFKNTSKSLQEDCPKGYFRLPKANVYAKGCSEFARAGEFEAEGLPNVNAGNYVNNSWRYSLNGKGGGGRDDWGCGTSHANFALSNWNSIYGRTDSVEVNHNLYLEGFYVGESLHANQTAAMIEKAKSAP